MENDVAFVDLEVAGSGCGREFVFVGFDEGFGHETSSVKVWISDRRFGIRIRGASVKRSRRQRDLTPRHGGTEEGRLKHEGHEEHEEREKHCLCLVLLVAFVFNVFCVFLRANWRSGVTGMANGTNVQSSSKRS